MLRWGMLCALLLPAAVSAQQVVRTIPLVLQLDVNAQGRVTAVEPMPGPQVRMQSGHGLVTVRKSSTPVTGELARAARKVAMQWTFKPRSVNGKPVSGRTWARARLQIVKQAKSGYGVRLLYQDNGPYIYSTVAPRYPRSMTIRHRYAGMVLEAVIEPDGSLSDLRVVSVHGNARGSSSAFRKAALESMRHWKGHAERIDGRAVPTHLRIPLYFMLGDMSQADRARIQAQVHKDMQPQGDATLKAPLDPGQALALDSPFEKQPSS